MYGIVSRGRLLAACIIYLTFIAKRYLKSSKVSGRRHFEILYLILRSLMTLTAHCHAYKNTEHYINNLAK